MFHLTYEVISAVDDFLLYCHHPNHFATQPSVERKSPLLRFTREVKNGSLTIELNPKFGAIIYKPNVSALAARHHHFSTIEELVWTLKPILALDSQDYVSALPETSEVKDSSLSDPQIEALRQIARDLSNQT